MLSSPRAVRAVVVVAVAMLLPVVAGCDLRSTIKPDAAQKPCVPPTLTIVGAPRHHGPLTVRPGQTLRLHGLHYTDDCAAQGAGTGQTISKLQLILQSPGRVGPVATVRPHGPRSEFTASVMVPSTTFAGPAQIMDVLGPPHGIVRLVVRR